MSGLPARASPRLRVETRPVGSPAAYLVDARVWNVVLLRLQNRAGQRSPFSSSLPRTPRFRQHHPPPPPGGRSGWGCIPTSPSHGRGWGVAPRSRGWCRLSSECWQALLDPPLPGEKEAHCLPRRHTSGPVGLSAWECLGGWLHRLLCPTLRVSEAVGLGGAQEFTCQPALQVTLILLV